MIKGTLFQPSRPPGQTPVEAQPYIQANITIPRLAINDTVWLFADTGADRTALHLRDAARIFGLQKFRRLSGDVESIRGVGGIAEYFVEPALIAFTHEDGTPEGFSFDLRIAKPSAHATNEFRTKIEPCLRQRGNLKDILPTVSKNALDEMRSSFALPAILGRDLLSYFRVHINWVAGEFHLNHI